MKSRIGKIMMMNEMRDRAMAMSACCADLGHREAKPWLCRSPELASVWCLAGLTPPVDSLWHLCQVLW